MGVVCSAAYFRCPVSDWKGFKLLMRVERVPTTWLTFTLLFRDGRGMESLHSEAKYKHPLFVLLVVFFSYRTEPDHFRGRLVVQY